MKKRLLSAFMASALFLSAGAAMSAGPVRVYAAESEESAAADTNAAAEASADSEDTAAPSGDLVDYLGADRATIEARFPIITVNNIPNVGNQLITENGIVFQTDANDKVDFISMYASSGYSVHGVYVGSDPYQAQAVLWQAGWKDQVLQTDLGPLWTFFTPEGYTATLVTDGESKVITIALTRITGPSDQ